MSQTNGIHAYNKPVENDFEYVYAENKDKGYIKVTKAMMKVLLGVATKLSELENDKGFVDNTVANLENYYLKTETYSKDELDDKLSLVPRFSVQVVTSLPVENISDTTVYLVPANEDEDNLYTEYINVNGLWEILGAQKIPKFEVTKESIESALGYTPADNEKVGQLEATKVDLEGHNALFMDSEVIEGNTTDTSEPVNLYDKSARSINTMIDRTTGVTSNNNGYDCTDYMPVKAGVTYKASVWIGSSFQTGSISTGCLFDKNKVFVASVTSTEAKNGVTPTVDGYIRLNLEKLTSDYTDITVFADVSNFPTTYIDYGISEDGTVTRRYFIKEEYLKINKGRYGVKWDINNPDDLGSRCFDSIRLSATIGIGSTNGQSDFDNIYPWCDMKRCNIKQNVNGAYIVTFEGEENFDLDGSNGDVFVRIPKFYVEKFIKDGYEYRVVSANGSNGGVLHPAFVENGKELDEIFVSAFEGYVDSDSHMRSIGGKIPTSNKTPSEFLTSAQANGDNYSLYDLRCVDAIWTLMAVEFGCRNTNHYIGYGISDYLQPNANYASVEEKTETNSIKISKLSDSYNNLIIVGTNITICKGTQQNILTQAKLLSKEDSEDGLYTTFTFDGEPINIDTTCFIGSAGATTNFCETSASQLNWHTGRSDFVAGSNTQNPIRYRWIENTHGNLWHYLPDVTFYNCQMYVCDNMIDYEMGVYTGKYKPIGNVLTAQEDNGVKNDVTDSNFWINSLINDVFAKGISFGKGYDKSLVSTQGFGAYYYVKSTLSIIANGGGFDHLYRCNPLTNRAWIYLSQKWYLYGARLMFKKIN